MAEFKICGSVSVTVDAVEIEQVGYTFDKMKDAPYYQKAITAALAKESFGNFVKKLHLLDHTVIGQGCLPKLGGKVAVKFKITKKGPVAA